MHMSCRDKLMGSMKRGRKVSLNSGLVMVVGEGVGDNEVSCLLVRACAKCADFHVSYTWSFGLWTGQNLLFLFVKWHPAMHKLTASGIFSSHASRSLCRRFHVLSRRRYKDICDIWLLDCWSSLPATPSLEIEYYQEKHCQGYCLACILFFSAL